MTTTSSRRIWQVILRQAQLSDCADAVLSAVGQGSHAIVVGQSFAVVTAPLVAYRLGVDALVFVARMIPKAGEPPRDWWTNSGRCLPADSSDVRRASACRLRRRDHRRSLRRAEPVEGARRAPYKLRRPIGNEERTCQLTT
jgi:hypothetical protein